MAQTGTYAIGGYLLAGGRSSRMGRDKALLQLHGKPLVLHAVTKLQRFCADVHILSSREELRTFAPLVQDLHDACGPMGGLEAAFQHSPHDWNLFMPVDMPFLPSTFLDNWLRMVFAREKDGVRASMFTVDEVPQPLLCLLHKDFAVFVREAMQQGEYKVFPVLEAAGKELAVRQGVPVDTTFMNLSWNAQSTSSLGSGMAVSEVGWSLSKAQDSARNLWFANINTRKDFEDAERHVDALDT